MPKIFDDLKSNSAVEKYYQRKIFKRQGLYYLFWAGSIAGKQLKYRVADTIENLANAQTLAATSTENSAHNFGSAYDVRFDHLRDRIGIAWVSKKVLRFKYGTFNPNGTINWADAHIVEEGASEKYSAPVLAETASGKWGIYARKNDSEKHFHFYTSNVTEPVESSQWAARGNVPDATVKSSAEYHRLCRVGNAGDELLLIYKEDDHVTSQRWNGSTLELPQVLLASEIQSNDISGAVVDSLGNVHVVYLSRKSGHAFFHAIYDAQTNQWSQVQIAAETGSVSGSPALQIDGVDTLHAFYRNHKRGLKDSIHYFKKQLLEDWTDETANLQGDLAKIDVYDDLEDTPSVAYFDASEVIIAWMNEHAKNPDDPNDKERNELWMDAIPLSIFQDISLKGPFWSAKADVLHKFENVTPAFLQQNHSLFRSLFTDRTGRQIAGSQNLLLPGVMIVLCAVKKVDIHPNGAGESPAYSWSRQATTVTQFDLTYAEIETKLRAGELSLLLLQTDPDQWAAGDSSAADFNLLVGDISLDVLEPQNSARDNLFASLHLQAVTPAEADRFTGLLSVTGSGLSIYGKKILPWEPDDSPIAAPFQLARLQPDPIVGGTAVPGYRLTIEYERLIVDETNPLIGAWRRLSRYVNPRHPLNGNTDDVSAANWVTLEIPNPLSMPQLFWKIAPWPVAIAANDFPVNFERGQFNLLIADRQAYDPVNPPNSLARMIPDSVVITRDVNNQLKISLAATGDTPQTGGKLTYQYVAAGNNPGEFYTATNLNLAYNPVETPRKLRQFQQLPTPEWTDIAPLDTPILWGFMPLEDGWAQLPILNLTEQIYLDAKVAQSEVLSEAQPPGLLQGAVTYGNDNPEALKQLAEEQAWSLTLINAQSVNGTIQLSSAGQNSSFEVETVSLEMASPRVTINGLLWLSSGKPTAQDALPDHQNWISGLVAIPLQTVQPDDDLFPAPLIFSLPTLTVSLRAEDPLTALLQDWAFRYLADKPVFQKIVNAGLISESVLGEYLPLIWRQHPSLPMIQALPLTQSQAPPNYPAASRQLVPFELATETEADIDLPNSEWKFGITADDPSSVNGAARWPVLLTNASPAGEWKSLFDLPLTALSLPGLVLDPRANPDETGLPADLLPAQFRFDLPYTDEINALAQLPKAQEEKRLTPAEPDAPDLQPEKPLTRETFAAHWQKMAEKANLAGAAGVAAFLKQNDSTVIQHLIEPYVWPVNPALATANYPGKLSLTDTQNGNGVIDLEKDAALEGISGRFVKNDDQTLQKIGDDETPAVAPFEITAGSMAAYRTENGDYLDQRGLARAVSKATGNLIKTAVKLADADRAFELTSLLQATNLQIHDADAWQFWFRDLPVATDSGAFDRSATVSAVADDVNDPEALSRERNYLNGYEWRLCDSQSPGSQMSFLKIFNLNFYPLTLENVTIVNDEIMSIEMIGRLQLPLPSEKELVDFSNAVRVTFQRSVINEPLKFSAIRLESAMGEWPLALSEGENNDAPHLFFKNIRLRDDGEAIEVDQGCLQFFLFGEEWSLNWPGIISFSATVQNPVLPEFQFETPDPPVEISPKSLKFNIDIASGNFQHTVSLLLGIQLGNRTRLAFDATARFHLLGYAQGAQTGDVVWENGLLFRDLLISTPAIPDNTALLFDETSLQFRWQTFTTDANTPWQILPGMHIQNAENQTPGFVTVTFSVNRVPGGVPTLDLKTAFVEMLISAGWGKFLQSADTAEIRDRQSTLGASAGQINVGYTTQWLNETWQESFLLNGFLEIKNLISWPTEMAMESNDDEFSIILPAARPVVQTPLNHIRHSIRILLNQHEIPLNQLVEGDGELLFNLAENAPWQFLAVAEHQLANVFPQDDFQNFEIKNDRRWTALQEIRLIFPQTFKTFLNDHRDDTTIGPIHGVARLGEVNAGYLGDGLRDALIAEIDKLPNPAGQQPRTLLVEASAPHWIRQEAVKNATATTLQFLPNGSQMGFLSSPDDFAPSKPNDPKWLLFVAPFLGRLQNQSDDMLDASGAVPDAVSALQIDPVLRIQLNRVVDPTSPISPVALALTNWADDQPRSIRISGFDLAQLRTWARLDATSLEENWFRLQNPLPESQATTLQSVMATLPDTPARLSRPTALSRAFDSFRPFYPPANPDPSSSQQALATSNILWHANSLLQTQGISSIAPGDSPPYGWHIAGAQLLGSAMLADDLSSNIRRFPAATTFSPAIEQDDQPNLRPLSFAVSPYLGLEFRPATGIYNLRLASAELLCLDRTAGQLLPAASHFWEIGEDIQSAAEIFNRSQDWAAKTRLRKCPDSPVAILRYREINAKPAGAFDATSPLTTTYSFAIVSGTSAEVSLSKRVFKIRTAVEQLRFREGQFGGFLIPSTLKQFEIAAPQVNGLQPLYMPERPVSDEPGNWPWGLSGLRMTVDYTRDQLAVIGTANNSSSNGITGETTLWWQAPQHFVQFRSALDSEKPTSGLPPIFRAPAIKSFLPVFPDMPLPLLRTKNVGAAEDDDTIHGWQPVLPGTLRYLLSGNRAGTMLALRHQLLRQSGVKMDSNNFENGIGMVSGSVPAQHRVPRPVALPPNRDTQHALQTWASFFEPDKNLAVNESPLDEAFFAECGNSPVRRLRMQLLHPQNGSINKDWDGNLVFDIVSEDSTFDVNTWKIALTINAENDAFDYITPTQPEEFNGTPGVFIFKLDESGGSTLEQLQTLIKRETAGRVIPATANVRHAAATDGFSQTLSFPLRVIDLSELPLPLKPSFIHFEDPEYNRQLASPSAHAAGAIKLLIPNGDQELHQVTIAADRRAYNPDSLAAVRFDWDIDYDPPRTATLFFQWLDSSGIPRDLKFVTSDGVTHASITLTAGKLQQFSLLDLQYNNETAQFQPGDALQLKLHVTDGVEPVDILLKTDIIAEPVVPVSNAAYALLRAQNVSSGKQVECARFAWGPSASRVELVCPADLRSEVVRRRAVFQWTDTIRSKRDQSYAIQKISPSGSTHFPEF